MHRAVLFIFAFFVQFYEVLFRENCTGENLCKFCSNPSVCDAFFLKGAEFIEVRSQNLYMLKQLLLYVQKRAGLHFNTRIGILLIHSSSLL